MKNQRKLLCCFFILFVPFITLSAQGMDNMYDEQTLRYWQKRYNLSMNRILNEGVVPFLTGEQRQKLAAVSMQIPLRGRLAKDPFGFYAYANNIVLSTQSLKFLDDLCIAYAWYHYNNHPIANITDYVAMLRYQSPNRFPGQKYPTPFVALGVPENALSNKKVDELSLRLFNSARAFILCHELGHIFYRHPGNKQVASAVSIKNEKQADSFAVSVLKKVPNIPVGAAFFFQLYSHWDWDGEETTHPLSSSRLTSLANAIRANRIYFAKDPANGLVSSSAVSVIDGISADLQRIATLLMDEELQKSIIIAAQSREVWTLNPVASKRGSGHTIPSHSLFVGNFSGKYFRHVQGSVEDLSVVVYLKAVGKMLNGTFNFGIGEGVITNGYVAGDKLFYDWKFAGRTGKGVFHTKDGGRTLTGTWGYTWRGKSYDSGGGEWSLTKN